MGINGLKVNYKLGREVAAQMSVVGFEAPVLNPQTRQQDRRGRWGSGRYVMELILLEEVLGQNIRIREM
jgi:hypothetical protein